MKTISVGELRQNPTAMLDEVTAGEVYAVTRHGREIARIVPVTPAVELIPPRRPGPFRLAELPPVELRTAATVEELLEWEKGEW